MDNYDTGIYTDNPDDTLRYMQTTQPVDLWGYPKQEQDLVEVVRCKDCRHRDPEDHKCDSGETERQGCPFKVADDYFCAYGER